jgi:hypothetical protein
MTDHPPSVQEEFQQEPAIQSYPPVSVNVQGPVRTQDLPKVINGIRKVVCPADNTPVNVANADPRRGIIRIISTDQPFILGLTRDAVNNPLGEGTPFPINVVIPFTGTGAIYAKSATNGTAATLSVIEEDWTE